MGDKKERAKREKAKRKEAKKEMEKKEREAKERAETLAETEKQQGDEAYKRKDFDTAIFHYEKGINLNPQDPEFPYCIAKSKFEQKKYSDCIEFCAIAVEVGKKNEFGVLFVANAYVLEGNAKIELGEVDKGRKAMEKAVSFLTWEANVRDINDNNQLAECYKFCDAAIKIGKEHEVDVFLMEKVMHLKTRSLTHAEKNPKLYLTRMIDVSEDYYNLKAKHRAQYDYCYQSLQPIVDDKLQTVDGENGSEWHRALALQNKVLRRIAGVDPSFDAKPWRKYTGRDKFFIPYQVKHQDITMCS